MNAMIRRREYLYRYCTCRRQGRSVRESWLPDQCVLTKLVKKGVRYLVYNWPYRAVPKPLENSGK